MEVRCEEGLNTNEIILEPMFMLRVDILTVNPSLSIADYLILRNL